MVAKAVGVDQKTEREINGVEMFGLSTKKVRHLLKKRYVWPPLVLTCVRAPPTCMYMVCACVRVLATSVHDLSPCAKCILYM
jgi:hypothetical protein